MTTEINMQGRPIDVDTQIRATAESVINLALTTAQLFVKDNRDGANATLEKMLEVYTTHMASPVSKEWASLPSLDEVKNRMVTEYGSYEGVSSRQVAEFDGAVDMRIRTAFERHVPRLRDIRGNSAVQLDTVKSCVGHIMRERDKAADELQMSSSGLLGKIRSRFMAQHGGDWNAEFMRDLSPETFAHAVAHTAIGVARDVANGNGHGASVDEVKYLADVADHHVSNSQYKTLSLISDIRHKTDELEQAQYSRMAFA